MKQKSLYYCLLMSTALLLQVMPGHAENIIGKVVSVNQQITSNQQPPLNENVNIYRDENLRSNNTGIGQFKFTDGTKMVLGPSSNITLSESIYNPNGKTFKKFALNTAAGIVRMISGESESSAYQIETPSGSIGIRGTAFDIHYYRGRTYVMLLSGQIDLCSTRGLCQTLRRKCSVSVISEAGNVSVPRRPAEGIFDDSFMERLFPLVADQSPLNADFRIPSIERCQGGASTSFGGGANGDGVGRGDGASSSGGGGSTQ